MFLILAAGFLCLAVLFKLLVHPIRSVFSIGRMLCAVLGLVLFLTAVGRFWNHVYLEAFGWGVAAVFLLWCSNRLSRQVA